MKNLLRIVAVTIITVLAFSSCSNKMSIAKRKYTKGYYIAHTGKKADVKSKKQEKSVFADNEKADESTVLNETAPAGNQNEAIAEAAVNEATKLSHQQVSDKQRSIVAKEQFVEKAFSQGLKKIEKLERITGNKKLSTSIKTKLNHVHTGDDVLSLFWVVILVILLVYLIALLFDSFGLGWFIHILLLVALIFLVLWLLHVV